ncbi:MULTISPECIES: type II toxin-antitoxin system VapC family toxin [unclassified Mesorhizobium]|uniref:type II toxin-antitoxin system VapC family toxin n=1 Tax=unclassified Mesorhizobium TaxID=325217 RepID=UPI000FD4040A|nr:MULTISPECIES: type II toxin-antitoxin system VapC family toxin [unclassified Mesorhizobium]RVB79394.1 type II toxin-antitoxin system VapC family toxin [Mesorhizobium sp. M6A.T.Cr.TU.014.01.1.1]RWP69629.1 MAG: type II toxin-antitoxin system VapC family toxin [Mesorhizobium sp.]RWP76295.1 MAG: type II toxin-antitoxin system VapC family toxin [Mesorhizobium sp.]RWQ03691.1 MAG: type II toxin-antitoxin system VapC family toxin [Mesorhizobium sp.]RWQ09635.1 MAG: type II toxin-antitoxin system Vap
MKISTLIDTNVLIDVWGPAGRETKWSTSAITACRRDGALVINTIVWSELAPLIATEAALRKAVETLKMDRELLPWEAAFLAGVTHSRYRRAGGLRERTLPDFFIGAHAVVAGHRLLTRDAARYRSYFPDLDIMSPETYP